MSKRVRTAHRRAHPTTVDVITPLPVLVGYISAATASLQSLSLTPVVPVPVVSQAQPQRHVRFGNSPRPSSPNSDKWSPKDSLNLLATVQSFDSSPGKEPNSVNWVQIAKIMNAHKSAHPDPGANYFTPEMCRHEYIAQLGTHGNKAGPQYTGEDMCSRTLRYLVYDYEMSESRKSILEGTEAKTA